MTSQKKDLDRDMRLINYQSEVTVSNDLRYQNCSIYKHLKSQAKNKYTDEEQLSARLANLYANLKKHYDKFVGPEVIEYEKLRSLLLKKVMLNSRLILKSRIHGMQEVMGCLVSDSVTNQIKTNTRTQIQVSKASESVADELIRSIDKLRKVTKTSDSLTVIPMTAEELEAVEKLKSNKYGDELVDDCMRVESIQKNIRLINKQALGSGRNLNYYVSFIQISLLYLYQAQLLRRRGGGRVETINALANASMYCVMAEENEEAGYHYEVRAAIAKKAGDKNSENRTKATKNYLLELLRAKEGGWENAVFAAKELESKVKDFYDKNENASEKGSIACHNFVDVITKWIREIPEMRRCIKSLNIKDNQKKPH